MRKKCKVCGAPLDNEKCYYCGTMSSTAEEPLAEQPKAEDIANSSSSSNEDDFLGTLDNTEQQSEGSQELSEEPQPFSEGSQPQPVVPQPFSEGSQPEPAAPQQQQMMMEPRRNNPAVIGVIIGIVLLILLIGIGWFIFTRLNANASAFDLLERSFAAMEEVDSLSADLDVEMRFTAPGMSMDMPLDARIYIELLDDFNMHMDMSMSMSILGMEEQISMYWRDGYVYTVENGFVTRELADEDDQMLMAPIGTTEFDSEPFEDLITYATAERYSGGHRLEFIIDEDALMDLFLGEDLMDILDEQDEFGVFDMFDDMFEPGEMSMIIYLDSDYIITSALFDMSVSFTMDGFDGTLGILADFNMDQVGDVTVDFPAYLDDIEEIVPTPVTDSELIGTWENGSGSILLWVFGEAETVEFLADGTVIITQPNGSSETVVWSPTGSGSFTAEREEFTYSITGNTLVITDSWNDSWVFDRADSRAGAVDTPVEDSELLGYWEDGQGLVFLWVFDEAESVEFLANGTVIITQPNGSSETVDWNSTGSGSFIADREEFTYSITRDTLIITDDWGDRWTFTRGDNGGAPVNNDENANNGENANNDNAEASDIENDLIGTWEWDDNDDYIYIFNDDGTATRGFSDRRTDFEWEITDGNVINMHIGTRTEEWEAVIVNDVLTISNLNNNNVWSYIRAD